MRSARRQEAPGAPDLSVHDAAPYAVNEDAARRCPMTDDREPPSTVPRSPFEHLLVERDRVMADMSRGQLVEHLIGLGYEREDAEVDADMRIAESSKSPAMRTAEFVEALATAVRLRIIRLGDLEDELLSLNLSREEVRDLVWRTLKRLDKDEGTSEGGEPAH
jgi:hypothetical protein